MTEPRSANTLLNTKLMPPHIRSAVISRPTLFARLDEGLTKKLSVVSAPTGFGKTTLVRMWISKRNIASAWVALDGHDNDPVRFWTYFIMALRTFDPSLGKTALATLSTSQQPSFPTMMIPLINELAERTAPGVLVLEDYHVITAVEIHATMTFLLQHLPEALHLVLISRGEPDLPLNILRARDELVEISAADLRFTPAETELFLRETVRAAIPTSAVETLHERTEGWAAGLRLAARSLQGKETPAEVETMIRSFSGSHRHVADYLLQEVFARQPATTQTFLLKTCFLNRLTGSLCDAVADTRGGETILEQLERENLFLVRLDAPRGSGRVWYRYTPLFAESIQILARQQLSEAGVRAIFEKASEWYAYQQLYPEAIETALTAQLFERALTLVETFVEIYNLNEMRTLTRWIERIPSALTVRHPSVCMMYAQVILFTSDRFAPATAARIEPYLQAAEQTWQAQGNDERVGTVLALRGMMLLWQGEYQKSLAAIEQALEKMSEREIFWRGVSLLNAAGGELYAGRMRSAQDKLLEARALLGASQNIYGMMAATGMMSEIFYAQGDFELCTQLNQQIMAEAVGEDSMLDDQGNARLGLANVAYERNELETAARYAAEALDLGGRRANELLQAQAASRLAFIQAARDETAQAQENLKTLAARLLTPLGLREIRLAEAHLMIRLGSLEGLGIGLAANHNAWPRPTEREAFTLARLRIAEGKPSEALALLESHLIDAVEQGRVYHRVEALCLKALAHQAAGNLSDARPALSQALAVGHEKGFRRLFLDEGVPMAALLRDLLPALSQRSLHLYATTLLRLFPSAVMSVLKAGPDSLMRVEPLSQQELRVLRLLVAGQTNADMASELVVSTNTIKTHVKNIYSKLNVNSREEARAVARELKLV